MREMKMTKRRPNNGVASNNNLTETLSESPSGGSWITALSRMALGQSAPAVSDGAEITMADISSLVLEYKDTRYIASDLVAFSKQASPVNISARECTYEPMVISRLFEVHAPWKYEFTPLVFSFDANGDAVFGANTANLVTLNNLNLITPGLIGFVIRHKATDTLSGNSSFAINKPSTGFSAEFELADINGEGIIAVLNHDNDEVKTVSVVLGAFAGVNQDLDFTETNTDVPTQLFFDYSNGDDWTITANNATLYVYPLVVTKELCALMFAAIFAGVPHMIPALIANTYNGRTLNLN